MKKTYSILKQMVVGAFVVISALTALGASNLTPYQPPGWSDKIVVARTTGTTTDSTSLTTADTLYVNWAVQNNGTTAAASTFYTYLYVDGVFKTYWTTASLSAGFYTYANDSSIGSLSAGTHTITITTDATGTIAESNESDNSYTKTITVSNPNLPNLTPYQPSGWSDKIVVARATGTTTDSTGLTTADTLYVNWAVVNSGNASAGAFYTSLYVDGAFKNSWYTASLNATFYTYVNDYSIGSLSAGNHTIMITTDSGLSVTENNEGDNSYTKTITVSQVLPDLTPYLAPGWSDKIVVSTTTGTTTDSGSLTTADMLYVDWAVVNNGNAAAVGYYTSLYVDGVFKNSWYTASLNAGFYNYINDYSIGSLSAGSHTITVTADSGLSVTESNEGNNSYTKTISVSAPNLTPYLPSGWSDKIVVSTSTGTTTDSATLSTADTLYVDWTVINSGNASTGSRFYTALYVDGTFRNSWYTDPPLASGGTAWVNDYSIGSLGAGTHTITVSADYTGTIVESSEGDNSYTKTITVSNPNLPAPTLNSPVNGSTGQSTTPTFSWSAVTGATSYRIMVATSAADLPTDPTVGTGGPSVVTNATTTTMSFTPSIPLNAGTIYYWEVHGRNSTQFGMWSTVYSFTTVSLSPAIRIQPTDLTFSCSASATPPPSQMASTLLAKPSWDGVLRGMSASPYPFEEVQSDGSRITLFIRGSVNFHWLEDTNGFTVIRDKVRDKANYVYAQLDKNGVLAPTSLLVGKADPLAAGINPRTLPSPEVIKLSESLAKFTPAGEAGPAPLRAPNGNVKNVVILMRFANHTSRTLPTVANFSTIFNSVGGDPILAPSGSVRDVYYENSYGTMTLNSTVFAWVTLPHTEAYYADGVSGRSPKVWEAITDALNLADPLVNFSQFDDDHDGFVDTITFIHSGYGAEWGGTDPDGATAANRIWSHRWSIPTWTSAEGVKVSGYDVNPGFWGTAGSQITHIGVITHETGHFFGLPDLYDTDSSSYGLGSWCMMANSWGFTGDQLNPPHFSAWAKIFLGWVTPTVIGTSGTYTAPQSETSPTVFRINNGYPAGEYLLVENRQAFGFDKNIPQGGLAVWHIDENKTSSDNTDNANEGFPEQSGWPANNKHYRVALLEADGNYNLERHVNQGDAGDMYRYGGVSEISHTTVPNTDAYQNGNIIETDNRIFSINSSGPNMTFDFSSASAGNSFVIYNDGAGILTVNSIALDQGAPWITWSVPATPFNIAPGGSQNVTVSVDCSQAPAGQSSRRLLVYSNDSSKSPYPGGVNITVNAPVPTISVTPAVQDFGSILADTTADRAFAVQNIGGGTLSGSATVAAPFSIVSGSPYSLTANQSTIVTVRYSPTAAGSDSQNVSFTGGGGTTRLVSGSAYLPTVATPTISPNGGNFADSVQVTLACSTVGATIRYTTDGNDPTASSTVYNVPFTLTSSATVKAKGFRVGYNDSTVASASLTVTPSSLLQLTGMNISNGVFRFVLNGPVGGTFIVQSSTNLVSWVSFSTNTLPAGGTVTITDPSACSRPARFYRAIPVIAGLVTYYPFDGNASDATGNGYDGIVYGAIADTDRFGRPNSSFNFSGTTNWIRLNIGSSAYATDYTISLWLKIDNIQGAGPLILAGDQGCVRLNQLGTDYGTNIGKVAFYMFQPNPWTQVGLLTSTDYLNTNQWYHLAVVRSGADFRIYLNGALTAERTDATPISVSGNYLQVGNDLTSGLGYAFHGNVDGLRIYNRGLSSNEIQTLLLLP